MDANEIWKQLCERHPAFSDPEHVVKLKARGLLALIEQAYNEGRRDVLAQTKYPTELEQLFGKFR